MKFKAAVLLVFALLFVACTHYHRPIALKERSGFSIEEAIRRGISDNIIKEQLDSVPPFGERVSLALVNNQQDAVDFVYWRRGADKAILNYNEWTRFFINSWTPELVKRGARVAAGSPNRILVSIDRIHFTPGSIISISAIDITLQSQDGKWKKTWQGKVKRHVVSESDISYLHTNALYRGMTDIMKDAEFIGKIKD